MRDRHAISIALWNHQEFGLSIFGLSWNHLCGTIGFLSIALESVLLVCFIAVGTQLITYSSVVCVFVFSWGFLLITLRIVQSFLAKLQHLTPNKLSADQPQELLSWISFWMWLLVVLTKKFIPQMSPSFCPFSWVYATKSKRFTHIWYWEKRYCTRKTRLWTYCACVGRLATELAKDLNFNCPKLFSRSSSHFRDSWNNRNKNKEKTAPFCSSCSICHFWMFVSSEPQIKRETVQDVNCFCFLSFAISASDVCLAPVGSHEAFTEPCIPLPSRCRAFSVDIFCIQDAEQRVRKWNGQMESGDIQAKLSKCTVILLPFKTSKPAKLVSVWKNFQEEWENMLWRNHDAQFVRVE